MRACSIAGFEFFVRPWADRDIGENIMPHGWFAAKYIAVLRNMLVREQDKELHLLSVLSSAWAGPGQSVSLTNAPSNFGPITFQASFRDDGMLVKLDPRFAVAPARIVLHVPWFVDVKSARAYGKEVAVRSDRTDLPPGTRQLDVVWKRKPSAV
ncbi:MAG: hypothetical protein NTY38_01915, partial [Acidobacteria bacterium]|nr:hypothetical protein [Acidobacteriota bacterium]